MHKTHTTLGNEKEQKEIKFYKKSSGKFIFLRATKNLKIFCFKNKVTPLIHASKYKNK